MSRGSIADALTARDRWLVLSGAYTSIDFDQPLLRGAMAEVDGVPLRVTDPATGESVAWAWRFVNQ